DARDGVVVAEVDVRGDHVDSGRSRLPDMNDVVRRPAARIASRFAGYARMTQGDVDVHRQRIRSLARSGDFVAVARDVPGVEELVRIGAEDVGPGAAGKPQVCRQLCGDLAAEQR